MFLACAPVYFGPSFDGTEDNTSSGVLHEEMVPRRGEEGGGRRGGGRGERGEATPNAVQEQAGVTKRPFYPIQPAAARFSPPFLRLVYALSDI